MKKDTAIREAIDESLCSVHFNAQDERKVLNAIHGRRVKAKKRMRRLNFAYAMGLLLLLVIPATAFTLHARRIGPTEIAAPGEDLILSADVSAAPRATAYPDASAAPTGLSEPEAIQAARLCYESLCDTSVFSFDEFTVSCQRTDDAYAILMTSIYGNGCSFSVTVRAADGEILQHSDAKSATQPTHLNEDSPEVQSWYSKYGAFIYLWPEDVQVEFSRRYEGASLRAARADDLTREQAQEIAKAEAIADYAALGLADIDPQCSPMLFSERAFDDGIARYLVVCGAKQELDSDADSPKKTPDVLVMLNAQTGEVERVKHEPDDSDRDMMKGLAVSDAS